MLLPQFKPATSAKKITAFIKKTLKQAKHTKIIIATSGGLDSSVALALSAQAIGPANVMALKLPYHQNYPQCLEFASQIIKHVKIPKRNVISVNIGPIVDQLWKTILIDASHSQTGNPAQLNQIRLGNIMARTRMIILYDTAKASKALVCGTGNKSEHLLGYFTRFGDAASDLEPITHLYKTQVRELAKYLKLPPAIIDQVPTAGLWPDQTDEAELGFPYEIADQVLYLTFEQKKSPVQIAKLLTRNYHNKPESYYKKLVTKVLSRAACSCFKHHLPHQL